MFQFTHVEGFALSSSKKAAATKSPKRNVSEIVAEVLRDEGACDHVDNPQPPTFHHGDEQTMRGLVGRIEKNIAEWKRRSGKTLRKDAQVLFTQVASYPKDGPDYDDWRRRNVDYLKRKYGDKLVAIIEHKDEDNPHLHAYVLNDFGANPDAKELHPGYLAAKGAENPKQQRSMYTKGMRAFQDEYYREVGMYCGMTRLGPGRRRLDRGGAMAEKAQAAAIKQGLDEVAKQRADIERRTENLLSEIDKKAKTYMKAEAAKRLKKVLPDVPEAPPAWQPWKVAEHIEQMQTLLTQQAEQLAVLPEMRELIGLYRSEGAKLKEQVSELNQKVDTLMGNAKAWATVQQVYPEVAREVVSRLNRPAPVGVVVQEVKPSVANETPGNVISLG